MEQLSMDGWDITPEQIIDQLREFGFRLFVTDDGVVHGKFRHQGQRVTLEMRPVIDKLQIHNNAVADVLRRETEYVGIPAEEAIAIGQLVKAGELELIGKVTYHKGSHLCDLIVRRKEELS